MPTRVEKDRRGFLQSSGLALAGMTAGSISLLGCSSDPLASGLPAILRFVSFSWTVQNLNGNAALSFGAVKSLILNRIHIDVAFGIGSTRVVGGGEVLCRGGIRRGAILDFESVTIGSALATPSAHFGSATLVNPNALSISSDQGPLQDIFYSVALKTWVPQDGAASETSRYVAVEPLLKINSNDGIVFQMQHSGSSGVARVKVVLEYM